MKCYKCIYYNEGVTDYGPFNECKKFGFEYYFEFYEENCPYIDDEYNLTSEGREMKEIF